MRGGAPEPAYRWFCRVGLEGVVPDHSTFSKNRHGRFRDSDLLRNVFETTVQRGIAEGLVGGEGFAVDASMIKADANRQRSVPGSEWQGPEAANHAVREYLAVPLPARSCAPSMKALAIWRATSRAPKPTSPQGANERRSRCGSGSA
jgi:IS5 family transposase